MNYSFHRLSACLLHPPTLKKGKLNSGGILEFHFRLIGELIGELIIVHVLPPTHNSAGSQAITVMMTHH